MDDWDCIGKLLDDNLVLKNKKDNSVCVLEKEDYTLKAFPLKKFSSFRVFLSDYLLGSRYLELTDGYVDDWYKVLKELNLAN